MIKIENTSKAERKRFFIIEIGLVIMSLATIAGIIVTALAKDWGALIWAAFLVVVLVNYWISVVAWERMTEAHATLIKAYELAAKRADRWAMLFSGMAGSAGATGEKLNAKVIEHLGNTKVYDLGVLARMLGGSEDSFTGELLRLVVKAQQTPANFRPLMTAFPDEVYAWQVWMTMDPEPTVRELAVAIKAGLS